MLDVSDPLRYYGFNDVMGTSRREDDKMRLAQLINTTHVWEEDLEAFIDECKILFMRTTVEDGYVYVKGWISGEVFETAVEIRES